MRLVIQRVSKAAVHIGGVCAGAVGPGLLILAGIELFKKELASLLEGRVESGEFGADMQVSLINDGPVTIFMDSRKRE